ncbi:MAG: glycosyltransferase [Planctomycetales bacterium]
MFATETILPTPARVVLRNRTEKVGLSLVLPAHNEEPVIRQAIEEAVAALQGLQIEYEVIVVDDGSTDSTAAVARDAAAGRPWVRVVSLPRNAGYAEALRTGFRQAQHELVAFTDADCQFDLTELDRLLSLARRYDVVCGVRVNRQDPWRRKLYSRGFNLIVRTLLGTGVRDCDCALKIFGRDWVNSAGLEAQGFFFNAELLARARQAGLSVTEVGVTHRPRQAGASKVSLAHIWPVLRTLLAFWWSRILFVPPREADPVPQPSSKWALLTGTALLGLLAALMILPRLSYPLLDPDETRYAEIAREMLTSGDWLIPTRQGKPYLDKPPLLYWSTAASFALFGTHEYSARLVASLAAIGTVLCTFWIGRGLVGLRAAWLGGLLQLACIGFVLCGRFLFMDSLLTLFTTISVLAGYAATRGAALHPGWWSLAAVACGLGTLTKGPIAPVLCLPPLIAALWLTSPGGRPRLRHWAAYTALSLGVAVPWFVILALREPQQFVDFFWTHHVERFVSGLSHDEPFWFYLPVLAVAMLPTSILLPAGIVSLTRGAPERRTWDMGYLLLFALWTFGLFSVSSCKLPPYILPAIPALCLMMGAALEPVLAKRTANGFLNYVREHSPRDLCAVACAAVPVVAIIDRLLLGESFETRLESYLGLGLTGVALVTAFHRGWIPRSQIRWGVMAAYTMIVSSFGLMDFTPAIAVMRCKVVPVLDLCREEVSRETPIICYSLGQEEDAFAFYCHSQRVEAFEWDQVEGVVDAIQRNPEALLFVDAANVERLADKLPSTIRLVELGRHEHIVVGVSTLAAPPRADPSGRPKVSQAGWQSKQ